MERCVERLELRTGENMFYTIRFLCIGSVDKTLETGLLELIRWEWVILECPILSRERMTSSLFDFLDENFHGMGIFLICRSLLEVCFDQRVCHVLRMRER